MPPRVPLAAVVALSLVGIALVGWVDHVTGAVVRVYPLYFVPIAWGAHRGGRGTALSLAAVSTLMWHASNQLLLPATLTTASWINVGTQGVAFGSIGWLVSELSRRLRRERELARRDPLTGLHNALSFREVAQVVLAGSRRSGHPVCLAYVDLDNFKAVNDREGHMVGDWVLRSVADTLRTALRAGDVAARLGGDEFVVLLTDTEEGGARITIERVLTAVREAMRSRGLPVTLSVGVVAFATAPDTLEAMIRAGDRLMYASKTAGKDRITVEAAP